MNENTISQSLAQRQAKQNEPGALAKDHIEEYILEHYGDSVRVGSWSIDSRGVHKPNQDGGYIWACRQPILPVALLWNKEERVEKVKLVYYTRGHWDDVIVPRSVISNKTQIVKLADLGIAVNSDNAAQLMRFITSVIDDSVDVIEQKDSCASLGWTDSGFLPYNSDIVFDGDRSFKTLYDCFDTKGDRSAWIDFVGSLRSNLELRMVLATSFASPLLYLLGENPFILEIWGGTGAGKTVALMVAASVWGNPDSGKLVRTMNMTQNSMLTTSAFLNHLPLFGDELQTIKNAFTNYDNLIMKITEGIDRARLNQSGQMSDTKSWKNAFIFSGEEPCTTPESGGGAKNRVIEIECRGKLVAEGNKTANFMRKNYGLVGREYIEHISSLRDTLAERYSDIFNAILNNFDTTDKQAGSMAVLLLADQIVSDLFWKADGQIALEDIEPFLATTKEVDVTERAYEFVVNTISENESRFKSDAMQRWGSIEDQKDGTSICYFNMSRLNGIMHDNNFSLNAVKNKWAEQGKIVRYKDGNVRYLKKIGSTNTSCVAIVINQKGKGDSDEDSTAKAQSYDAPESAVSNDFETASFKEVPADEQLPF